MMPMKIKTFMAAIAIFVLIAAGIQLVKVADANPIAYCPEIIVKSDGSITPTTELLVRNADTYYLTSNITNYSVAIQRSNIVFDGAGYTINGAIGIIGYSNKGLVLNYVTNVTVKDVTVKNFWSDNIAVNNCSYCTLIRVQSFGGQPVTFPGYSTFNKVTRCNINDLAVSFSNNTFYGNNIYHIQKPSLPNIWDNGMVGNYWSDYTGSGPYVLNSNNKDNFPNVSPFDIQLPVLEPTPTPSPAISPQPSTPPPTIAPSASPNSSLTLSAGLAESASSLYIGNTINFTVTAQGGKEPYTYSWNVDNQTVEASSSPYYSLNTLAVGEHHVYVQVTDAENSTATTLTVAFDVLPNPSSSPAPSPSPSVPEFPAWTILPPVLAGFMGALVFFGRRKDKLWKSAETS